mmetsp:Transcript_481/g.1410  ORF Transcript_481/g.1410 Transcript_481/m.1410 type:complete len:228 (-) Transcript_481:195-878(-)
MPENIDPRSASNVAGASNSPTVPPSITKMRSLSMIVFRRCAIVRIVQSWNDDRIVAWIAASVWWSTDEVASSSSRMRALASSDRVSTSSCRSPCEKFSPNSATSLPSPPASSTLLRIEHRSSASQIASSSYWSNGSMLERTVPLKMTGFCGTMESLDRSACRPILDTSTPSMVMGPDPSSSGSGSTRRRSESRRLDLPPPVRPTTPTRMPGSMSSETPLRTSGVSGR